MGFFEDLKTCYITKAELNIKPVAGWNQFTCIPHVPSIGTAEGTGFLAGMLIIPLCFQEQEHGMDKKRFLSPPLINQFHLLSTLMQS